MACLIFSINYGSVEYETGEWNFEIPVSKKPSWEYVLDEKTEVEGIPVRFDKLTIAPTTTILQYGINTGQQEKRIDGLNFDHLEVNNKKIKTDLYGNSYLDTQQDMNWNTFQAHFPPLFREKPKEVNVQLGSVYLTIEDKKTIELDAAQEYPQTFEYAGSTISIDKVELGQPTKIVISNLEIKNREYESLQLEVVGEDENGSSSMERNIEGVLVDKNGVEYDDGTPFIYEKIDQPRYFITVERIGMHSNNYKKDVIPKSLKISGYNTTKYIDDVVKFSIE